MFSRRSAETVAQLNVTQATSTMPNYLSTVANRTGRNTCKGGWQIEPRSKVDVLEGIDRDASCRTGNWFSCSSSYAKKPQTDCYTMSIWKLSDQDMRCVTGDPCTPFLISSYKGWAGLNDPWSKCQRAWVSTEQTLIKITSAKRLQDREVGTWEVSCWITTKALRTQRFWATWLCPIKKRYKIFSDGCFSSLMFWQVSRDVVLYVAHIERMSIDK